jgi:hypothetical protein
VSVIADEARVAVFLADYAAADAVNKINAIGLGWAVTGTDPSTGLTAPQTLVAMLDVPPDRYGEDFTLTLTLRDEAGAPVALPGPAGTPQPMRIAQIVRAEEPTFGPAMNVPRDVLWAHVQVVLNLGNGLPLQPGLYSWQLDIDGKEDPKWRASFYVPGPRPAPVFGGPANPAHIPGVDPRS